MIAVPVAADIAGRFRFLADLADHRKAVRRAHGTGVVELDLAEALRESQMLGRRELLVAKEDDAMFVERVADFLVGPLLQRIRQVHVVNFSANGRGDLTDIDGGIFHCGLGWRICRTYSM